MLRTLVVLFLASSLPGAQEWPQFRGPGGRAVARGELPEAFGPGENELWSTALPPGHSSPCVVGSRIFVTGFEDGKYMVLAVAREGGGVLWRKSFEGAPVRDYLHSDAQPATPTPAADGERVVAYFATFGLVALDFDGEVLWEKRLPDPGGVFGMGSSPIVTDGLVIVARDGAPEAGILGLDAADGAELWRIDRFGFTESHGTPFLWENDERFELVVAGTNRLVSYDPGSGKQLWWVEGLTTFPCTTPTGDGDTLYFAAWSTPNATGRSLWESGFARSLELSDEEIADPKLFFERLDTNRDGRVVPDEVPECRAKDAFEFIDRDGNGYWEVGEFTNFDRSGGRGENLMVAVPAGAKGKVTKDRLRWSWERGLPYVASPLLHRGRLWLVKSGGFVTCLDAKSGEPVFDRARLGDRGEYYASPVGVGGRVLVGSAEGTLYALDADADELSVVHETRFDDALFATPAVVGGTVYIRTKTRLWAFGSKKEGQH